MRLVTPANFEMYLRSLVLAVLSVAIVAAALFQVTVQKVADPTVLGWAAAIVGFYLGQHVTTNGMRATRNAVQVGAEIDAKATAVEKASA